MWLQCQYIVVFVLPLQTAPCLAYDVLHGCSCTRPLLLTGCSPSLSLSGGIYRLRSLLITGKTLQPLFCVPGSDSLPITYPLRRSWWVPSTLMTAISAHDPSPPCLCSQHLGVAASIESVLCSATPYGFVVLSSSTLAPIQTLKCSATSIPSFQWSKWTSC